VEGGGRRLAVTGLGRGYLLAYYCMPYPVAWLYAALLLDMQHHNASALVLKETTRRAVSTVATCSLADGRSSV
jgi:hypothetical protein